MTQMEVLGVRVELPTNQPIVLLKERGGRRHLPIWVGAAEASAIAFAQQGIVPPRPLTHDLLVTVIGELGHRLTEVRITGLIDGAFHAVLVVRDATGRPRTIDSRSSDAIALAVRTGVPVEADEALLTEVGIVMDDPEAPAPSAPSEDVLAEFKEFLDTITPEDFGAEG